MTTDPHRVLLVEDHPLIRYGLAALLEGQPDLTVVGQADTAEEARRVIRGSTPDLIVLPLRLGGDRVAGIELCRHLRAASTARTLVYTSFTDTPDLEASILAGADGLVGKWAAPEELLHAVRAILRGRRIWLPGPLGTPVQRRRTLIDDSRLTRREREVLALILERHTNQQIADRLVVNLTTVKTHVRSILRKLGMESRRDLFTP